MRIPYQKTILVISFILNIASFFFLRDRILDKFSTTPPVYSYQRDELFEQLNIDSSSSVFLGDSFTHQFEIHEFFKDENVKNRGIDGDKIRGIINRISPITKIQPKKIFILAGVNDLGSGRSVENIISDYNNLIDTLIDKCPKTTIYLQSIFPVAAKSHKFKMCNPETNDKIRIINAKLKEVAKTNSLQYLDNYHYFEKQGSINPDYVLKDGLHLSSKGYLLWAKLLKPHIKPV